MKSGVQVSPLTGGIVIAVVVAILVFFGVRSLQGPHKVQMTADMAKKIQESGHGPQTTAGGRTIPTSGMPAGVLQGK